MNTYQNKPISISIREDALAVLRPLSQKETPCETRSFRNSLLRSSSSSKSKGAFLGCTHAYLSRLLKCLVEKGLVTYNPEEVSVIGITPLGSHFLKAPLSLRTNINDLFGDPADRQLMRELREIRLALSTTQERPPYVIFRDFTLLRIVIQKPLSVSALNNIPGLGDYKINQYGYSILQAVRKAQQERQNNWQEHLKKRAGGQAFQSVKALFEAGASLEEIAKRRQVKVDTIRQTLEKLHYAGEIDLIPWIERNLDPRELQRGTAYFRAVENPRLKEAYERLGLTYAELRLCRLYVSRIVNYEEELRNAS